LNKLPQRPPELRSQVGHSSSLKLYSDIYSFEDCK